MKKAIAVLVAGVSFALAPAAQAAEPVSLTGDISATYERDTYTGEPDTSGSIFTFTLKGEANLGSNWSAYARLGAQKVTNTAFGDFNRDAYGDDKKSVVYLDQFGLIHKDEIFTYKIGRQDATVGTTALLYSRPDSNIGKRTFVDGVSISGKSGVTELTALLAREDNAGETPKNKVYAIRAGYSPAESMNWGLTFGRYQGSLWNDGAGEYQDATSNHWAVDGTYKFGKNSLTGEYTQSNFNADNKAYALTLNHDFNEKTAAYITSFRVEANGAMGQQSDFDPGRGIHYGVTHNLKDNVALEVVYKDQKDLDKVKNTVFEATVSYSF